MAEREGLIYQQTEKIQDKPIPNFQGAFQEVAESQNLLPAIGAKVAQSASNEMAKQFGYEAGKTPHGNLTPSLTEFDKNFAESYNTQAHATLALQGQKLLDDASLALAKYPKLTPDLIANTNKQVQAGLARISQNAPIAVRGQLESSFASKMLQQNYQYQEKMIREDREDQKNTALNAIDLNVKNALELARNGDAKGADNLIEATRKLAQSSLNSRLITPEQARVAVETAEQTKINGLAINQAIAAETNGKLAEYERDFIARKVPGTEKLTNEQLHNAGVAIHNEMAFRDSLKSQDENITAQRMLNDITINANAITPQQWLDFKNNVSPLKYEQVKNHYIQALKKKDQDTNSLYTLMKNWGSSEAHANADPKIQKETFNALVQATQDKYKISHEAAQNQVAASAGAKVEIFTKILKDKLNSGNPNEMDSASLQIHELEEMNAGHALDGLSEEDKALNSMYQANRGSMDPIKAAQETINNIKNTDPAVLKLVKEKWREKLWVNTKAGIMPAKNAIITAGLAEGDFINPTVAQVYGTDLNSKYESLYQTFKGDDNLAQAELKKYAQAHYGETRINGGRDTTFNPIEKQLGFTDYKAIPFIQQDVVKQFNERMIDLKKQYDDKKSNEYWEAVPVSGKNIGTFRDLFEPVKVKRHMRTESGEKIDTFNVTLLGNAYGSWDVAIQTDSGMRNLFDFAPQLGILTYIPNKKDIQERVKL